MPRFIVIDTGDIGRIARRIKFIKKPVLKDILYDFAVKVTDQVQKTIVVENTYPSYSSRNNTFSIITSPTVLKDIPSNDNRFEPPNNHNNKDILELINRWDKLDLKKHLLKTTKSYRKDYESLVKLTNGTAFNHIEEIDPIYVNRKFNSLHWDTAIKRFAIAVKDPSYYPIDKSKIANLTIADFIYSPYMVHEHTNKIGSNFLLYLENEPKPLLPTNSYPLITESFIELFAKKYPDCPLTIEDRRDLIKASNQTGQFFENNEKNIVRCDRRFRQPYQKAEIVFRAVEPALPADLTPPYIYTDKLVKFIDRIGLWRS